MEKLTFKGDYYYYSKGKWLDSHFIEVPQEVAKKLSKEFPQGRYVSLKKASDKSDSESASYSKALNTQTKKQRKKTKQEDWEELTDAMDHRVLGSFWTH